MHKGISKLRLNITPFSQSESGHLSIGKNAYPYYTVIGPKVKGDILKLMDNFSLIIVGEYFYYFN